MSNNNNNNVLSIKDLRLHFRSQAGTVQAVDGVDLDLGRNDAIVILGESGCGKTSFARAILRLLPRNIETYDGNIYMDDMELMGLSDEEYRRQVRWVKMSMVPQAAMNALNPVLKVGDQVAEPLMVHAGVFLLLRLEPLILEAPQIGGLLLILGLLTVLYGWLGGLVQTDVKSALIFSTTAQVGLMFVWCGLGCGP